MTSNKPVSKRLFVGSLPYNFSEGELLSLFVIEGKIIAVKIVHNKWGKSRGMGYVEFEKIEDAVRAKTKLHNSFVGDRTIIVDYAEPDPFLTEEGRARHQEAISKHKGNKRLFKPYQPEFKADNPNYVKPELPARRGTRKNNSSPKPEFKFKSTEHVRKSLFTSRNFGSKIGSKFASRNKKKR